MLITMNLCQGSLAAVCLFSQFVREILKRLLIVRKLLDRFLGQFIKIDVIYVAMCFSIQDFVFIDAYW